MDKTKPLPITKRQVWEAYKRVRANKGAAGYDGQSLSDFEGDLSNNLYKLWNRLASGSYHPQPVKRVEIPKDNGAVRPLGIPTVADRIAQMVVKSELEPTLEACFHPDSYGYRPYKSALDAVGAARQRCWRYDWVISLDIQAFFDHIDHALLMRALRKHTQENWVLLYIERWLKAPVAMKDGTVVYPEQGTPQGGVISPLLANLYLHYTFDLWMQRNWPGMPFERYADDIVCHCQSEEQAIALKTALRDRFAECKLTLHPTKTQIIYCKDEDRVKDYPLTRFDFLGYTYRTRLSKSRYGKYFANFTPAMSDKAAKRIRQEIRQLRWNVRPGDSLSDLANECNAKIRGWMAYYGRYCYSSLYKLLEYIDYRLALWATHKFKRFKGKFRKARKWLDEVRERDPHCFVHWARMSRG
ncbi:MAG: group II intron reverse transcriptase/maturase [Thiolinea sp.]